MKQDVKVGEVVKGAGQRFAGRTCLAAAGEVARSRYKDMADFRERLPLGGRAGLPRFPRETLLQVVPMRGEQLIEASMELRVPFGKMFGLVLFADAGVVQLEPNTGWELVPSITVGGGIRLKLSFIGVIRFDVGFVVNKDRDRYPLQEGLWGVQWDYHLSIGQAF